MVRVEGVEPSSQPWEGYIIAAIRYPREISISKIPNDIIALRTNCTYTY